MARAAKVHCLERGRDPRDYTLVAFGGAGPVHANRVAETLGINIILYPAHAGVMSAFGFLAAPPSFELMRTTTTLISEVNIKTVRQLLGDMEIEGKQLLGGTGIEVREMKIEREAAIRYRGQTFSLFVPIPS